MPRVYQVKESLSGVTIAVRPGESLLQAIERCGLHCIQVGCRSGGCGVCRIRTLSGDFKFGPMSARFVPPLERAQGWALACRTYPLTDGEIITDPLR